MTRMWLLLLVALAVCAVTTLGAAAAGGAPETPAEHDARLDWWRDARFGLFIHWGPYAVPAGIHQGQPVSGTGEWIMYTAQIPVSEYEPYARQFNPREFDADAWVRLARDAGMKYIVITSKHHDGFCLWDSPVSDYDIMDFSPFKRDILKELADACRRQGMPLGFYYSIMDWHHPQATGADFPKYRDGYMIPQLEELLAGYGDIGVLWFDGYWIDEWTEAQGRALYDHLRGIRPDLIINNRIGRCREKEGMSQSAECAGDFGTPEQEIPAEGLPGVDWETCMTMNDTWGFKADDHNWKSADVLIRQLVDVASKGGNFLLNVGPTAEGLIPPSSVERLQRMGRWLAVNGEAVYGTTASPLDRPAWGRYTKKTGRIFAHVFEWPADGRLVVAHATMPVIRAYLLADKTQNPLPMETTGEGLVIGVPDQAPDPVAAVIVMELSEDSRRPTAGDRSESSAERRSTLTHKITPFLMFEGSAEEAMRFYVSVFPGSDIGTMVRYGPGEPGPEGSIQRADFTLAGQPVICIDSPIPHAFTFTPAMSLFVECADEAELDRLVEQLSKGGEVLMPPGDYGFSRKFGWVNDRFGVSWQLNLQ
ncbi:MAG: alpha-L-fucosidase [Acidobacteria bacterium]|nr:alpha-L-fucosidase [Acidobacteriota bacterium]